VGEFVDGALDSGADRVAGLPVGCLLLGADAELQGAELQGAELQGAEFSWGEKPTVRALSAVVVQRVRAGQGRHWLLVNRATISAATVVPSNRLTGLRNTPRCGVGRHASTGSKRYGARARNS
jgi:hypothetical protein